MRKKPKHPKEIAEERLKKEIVSFTLTPKVRKKIKKMAEEHNISHSSLVEAAILYYIDYVEKSGR